MTGRALAKSAAIVLGAVLGYCAAVAGLTLVSMGLDGENIPWMIVTGTALLAAFLIALILLGAWVLTVTSATAPAPTFEERVKASSGQPRDVSR